MMLDRINWHKNSEIPLGKLINDLEALLEVLQNKNEKFEDEFLSYLGSLEIIYAFMLYEKRKSIDEEDKKQVYKSLDDLEKLIHFYYG